MRSVSTDVALESERLAGCSDSWTAVPIDATTEAWHDDGGGGGGGGGVVCLVFLCEVPRTCKAVTPSNGA